MKTQVAIFLLAVQFLTRLPIPSGKIYSPERLTAAARYYPLVGLLIGSVCAGTFWAFDLIFPTLLSVLLSTAIGLLLTGAFHEDGLADTFDGIGGGHSRDQALTIMKDSRLGTYGTLALVSVLAIKVAGLAAMQAHLIILALILGHGLSRFSSVLVILTSTYARDHGTAKPVASGLSVVSGTVAAGTGFVMCIAACFVAPIPLVLSAVAGLIIGHIAMRTLFEQKLGGYTGDTLGAVQQVSEIGLYLGMLAWLS